MESPSKYPMAIPESRNYQLAKATLLAILLALSPVPGTLQAQTKPAAATEQKEDPLAAEFKKAEKSLDAKKYAEALKSYEDIDKKAPPSLEPRLRAVLSFRKATCYYLMKDWAKAEAELNNFLAKFDKGTEDFFDAFDNKRGVAQLSLVEVLANQSKWDQALGLLEKLRSNPLLRAEDRVNAFTLSAKIIEEKSKSASDAEKRQALGQALGLLKTATAQGIDTPERREAGFKLVEVYTKLGMTKEAEQLKSEIDARSNGSPADIVRSNFQRIEIGDARFEAAENADEKEKPELYRQALVSYQGALRRNTVARAVGKAVEARQQQVDALLKQFPKPTPEQTIQIEAARGDVDQFKKIETDFNANKDYDAFISYRIGLCLLELNKPWEAFIAFRDIFDNNPNFSKISGAYYYYILALRNIGRNTEAQAKCKEFLEKYPDSDELSQVAIILGEISQDREEYPEAIEHYKWAKANVKKLDAPTVEEIDFRIAACLFAHVEWEQAGQALEEFLKVHPRSMLRQQASYMSALCWFYQGKYKETVTAFDKYQADYPKGQFMADVRYRQGIVKFGLNPPQIDETLKICNDWLRDYAVLKDDEIVNQIPEVHTLIGDAEMRLAENLDKAIREADMKVRTNSNPAEKKRFFNEKVRLEKDKETYTSKGIEAYINAAKTARKNPNALEFVLRELGKLLPGRGEHQRLRDLYKEIYDWNHNDPKALNYLYEIIKSTERMGDKPEFAQETDQVQKKFSQQLADARRKVDDLERKESPKPIVEAAKADVVKLSTELAAALEEVDKRRQASIAQAKEEALGILSTSVAESINDRKQEGAEKLVIYLAEKLARRVKRVKPGVTLPPGSYTAEKAEVDLVKYLRLEENKDSLIAQARGFFALGQIATFLRNPEKADTYFQKISNNYKAEELSPTILAIVGDYLLTKGETAKAETYFTYIMEHHRSSEYADFSFAGLAEIRLSQNKPADALALCNEAIDNNITMSKEKEIRFARARALANTEKYPDAKKEFEEIAKEKQWRGETTAGCLYWLGVMEERQGHNAEAVAYYRRCYQAWKKYEVWSAKAYLSAAKVLANKMGQKPEAKLLLTEMLSKDRIKDTPEAKEARALTVNL